MHAKFHENKIHVKISEFTVPFLFQGKGFPDMNTRLLLRRLWDVFSIPILALVDADPHGMLNGPQREKTCLRGFKQSET